MVDTHKQPTKIFRVLEQLKKTNRALSDVRSTVDLPVHNREFLVAFSDVKWQPRKVDDRLITDLRFDGGPAPNRRFSEVNLQWKRWLASGSRGADVNSEVRFSTRNDADSTKFFGEKVQNEGFKYSASQC